ncbi:MAG: ABC transporter ATP-binding protein, partial [Spirochaetota bacterium]
PDYITRIWTEVGIFFVVWILVALCIWGFIRLAGISAEKLMYLIRKKVFNHIQKLSFSYFDRTPVGWIMARLTSDIERFSDMMAWYIVDFVWAFAVISIYTVIMLITNWKLALIVIASLPILWIITFYFNKRILKAQRESRKLNSQITRNYNESINGVKVIKSMVQHDRMHNEFKELSEKMYKATYRAGWYQALYIPMIVLVSSIVLTLILIAGGYMYIAELGMTVGILALFISYAVSFFEPLNQLAVIFAEFQRALASAERVFSLMDTEPEIIDESHSDDLGDIKGDIEFRNVSFAYEKDKYVLKNFNIKIKAGQTIAFVGPTGAGKSTIINLICRFYEPTEGQILIDGVDYRERTLHSLQSRLGIVLQTPHLFSGTIKENILYGKLDAADEEIREAARFVNADKFIEKLPKTYDEQVGESGNLLSTGEKQLISFARAAIVNPQIFIMDEATSSVDTLTEQLIQEGMHRLLEGKTCFVIAHRLSTIKQADRILVIKDGEIEEDGTHKELLTKKGHYYKLYTKQLREEKEQSLGLVSSETKQK